MSRRFTDYRGGSYTSYKGRSAAELMKETGLWSDNLSAVEQLLTMFGWYTVLPMMFKLKEGNLPGAVVSVLPYENRQDAENLLSTAMIITAGAAAGIGAVGASGVGASVYTTTAAGTTKSTVGSFLARNLAAPGMSTLIFGMGYGTMTNIGYRTVENALGSHDTATRNSILYNFKELNQLSDLELRQLKYDDSWIQVIRSMGSNAAISGVGVDPFESGGLTKQELEIDKLRLQIADLKDRGLEVDPYLEGNLRKLELDIALKEKALVPVVDPYQAGNLELQRLNIARLKDQLNSTPDPMERRYLQVRIEQIEQQMRVSGEIHEASKVKYSAWDDFDVDTKESWLAKGVDKGRWNSWKAASASGLPVDTLEEMYPEIYDNVQDEVSYGTMMEMLNQLDTSTRDPERESDRLDPKGVVYPRDLYNLGYRKSYKRRYRKKWY